MAWRGVARRGTCLEAGRRGVVGMRGQEGAWLKPMRGVISCCVLPLPQEGSAAQGAVGGTGWWAEPVQHGARGRRCEGSS